MNKNIYRLALTGGLGSGKTTVLQMFAKLPHCQTASADDFAHKLLLLDPSVQERLIQLWGKEHVIDDKTQKIDKKRIADFVFHHPQRLEQLNQIIHPLIHNSYIELIKKTKPGTLFVYEIPLLFEVALEKKNKNKPNIYEDFDCVLVIAASTQQRMQRVQRRKNWSVNEFERRERFHIPLNEKVKKADLVIFNNNDLNHLQKQIVSVYHKLIHQLNTKS